jgi:C-terminal processing protease CtpA/Prc
VYYDPAFRGVDIEAARDSAQAEIKRADSDQERAHAIERYLMRFDDSHTFFVSPRRIRLSDFHLGLRFSGDAAFVVRVDEGSAASAAGLRAGDEIVTFNGQPLTRASYYRVVTDFLATHPIKPLDLTVRAVDRSQSQVSLIADTTEIYRIKGAAFRKLISQHRDSSKLATSHVQATIADSVFLWRLPQFRHDDGGIDDVMKRVRKHSVLVLDLRGNGGGSIETLTKLVSHFADREVLIGELHARFDRKKFVAKPKKERFNGRFFILIDSETASAAEIFARLMQLEGKAKLIGDRTAGAVMASMFFPSDDYVGASITISDFVLHNGERLEKVGVSPDILAVTPAQAIAAGTDPQLSYALLQAGARVSPANAGKLLPVR